MGQGRAAWRLTRPSATASALPITPETRPRRPRRCLAFDAVFASTSAGRPDREAPWLRRRPR